MAVERNAGDAVSIIKFDTSFGSDAGGDFTLPDYMPEIKRLLYVSASALPEGKFIGGGVLELDGVMSYNAVYVGDDDSLCAAPLNIEYSADTALPAAVEGTDSVFVDTVIESTTCRATGPRSLSIKSRLKFRVSADDTYAPEDDGGAAVERLTEEVPCVVRRRGGVTETAAGTLSAPEGDTPVICDGTLVVTSATLGDGGVRASGKICARCVTKSDSGYAVVHGEIPFETTVPIESDVAFTGARAWGRIASLNVTQGDDGDLFVTAEYDLDAEAYAISDAEICTDAYARGFECDCALRDCEIPVMIAFGADRVEVTGETELKNPDGARVLATSPAQILPSVTASDGKIAVTGSVRLRVLINADGEIYAQEMEMPLRHEIADAPDGVTTADLQSFLVCS
ncbi:MAG: DUF3794 domain-containing protein, partial [Clostridia bacterium]|nr:DUF3794 domain-containing protein [Clostridia bacterium]